MLDAFIVACVEFMIMLIELKKVPSQEQIKCLCRKTITILIGMNCTKNYDCESLKFLMH